MTPEEKWLLILGSGWVGWFDVVQADCDVLFYEIPRDRLEVDNHLQQVRLKPQHEPIRVHVAPTPGVHTV